MRADADDVDLMDGAWFVETARSAVEHGGVFQRLAHVLPTDEILLAASYAEEAEVASLPGMPSSLRFAWCTATPIPADRASREMMEHRDGHRERTRF